MRVSLDQGSAGRWAVLRPLTGHDELAIDREWPDACNALLDRLLVPAPGTAVAPGSLASVSVADRDRLLAAVFQSCFGDRIGGAAACAECGESYEFGFQLSELMARARSDGESRVEGPDSDGFYRTPEGIRFRPPTVGDIEAVRGLAPAQAIAELRRRCVAGDDPDETQVQAAMEGVAPVLDVDMEARCPHCRSAQSMRFSLAAYLIDALTRERRFLTQEVHRLAVAYGWGLGDILSLSRDDRRTLVRQIDIERLGRSR